MNINFDMKNVELTEFGIGRDELGGQSYYRVPVDGEVQDTLNEMARDTMKAMQELATEPRSYDPAEKYDALEYVYIPIKDELASSIRQLHEAEGLPINDKAMTDTDIIKTIFCYFARLVDSNDKRLTAVRQSAQFKGILKSRNHLVRIVNNTLEIIPDDVFKLDVDFDFIVDAENIHILRPSSFAFTGKITSAVLAAVPQNIDEIERALTSVDFGTISVYASEHPRAARYLAAIRSRKEAKNINRQALIQLCACTGVKIDTSGVKIVVDDDHIMGFLEVLDRRRYEIELVSGSPERYKAASREKL